MEAERKSAIIEWVTKWDTSFNEIQAGEWFESGGQLYLRTDYGYVNIQTGDQHNNDNRAMGSYVIPVNVQITVKEL